jgi:hypothetical protein
MTNFHIHSVILLIITSFIVRINKRQGTNKKKAYIQMGGIKLRERFHGSAFTIDSVQLRSLFTTTRKSCL